MARRPSFTFLAENGKKKIKVMFGCKLGHENGHKVYATWFPNSGVIKFDEECPMHRVPRILNHEVTHVETPLDEESVEKLERGQAAAQKAFSEFLKKYKQKNE